MLLQKCILPLLCVLPVFGFAQRFEPDLALSPGIVYQGEPVYELNLLAGRYVSEMSGNAFPGVRLGVETNFRQGNEWYFAPKAGFELSGMIICFRGTAMACVQRSDIQFRLVPEIGVSLAGLVNLTYGYAFAFNRPDGFDLPRHRIALSLNLNRDVADDAIGW